MEVTGGWQFCDTPEMATPEDRNHGTIGYMEHRMTSLRDETTPIPGHPALPPYPAQSPKHPGGPNLPAQGFLVGVVDDEATLRATLSLAIRREGMAALDFADGLAAWEHWSTVDAQDRPGLYLLDVTMPRMDGLELCRRLRSQDPGLPILFLSSRDEEIDRILGLELGADDYVTKPFSLREVLTRIKVCRRRLEQYETVQTGTGTKLPRAQARAATGPSTGREARDSCRVDLDLPRFELRVDGLQVPLSVTEFRMFQCLAAVPGHVKTRDQLRLAAYPEPTFVSDRTIDTHIKRIRRKLSQAGINADCHEGLIQTVHGLGYRCAEA